MTQNISNSGTIKTFYYIDNRGAIQTDIDNTRLGAIRRSLFTFGRDYNIFHVHQKINGETPKEIKKRISLLIAKKCGIKESDYKALKKMSTRAAQSGTSRAEQSNIKISEFLDRIETDRSLNRNLNTLIKKVGGLATVNLSVLQDVATYSFKIQKKEEMIRVADKADEVFRAFQNGQGVEQQNKLTISEVRTLESLAKMKPILDRWSIYQNAQTTVLSVLSEKSTRSEEIIESLTTQAEEQSPIQAGTFILYDMDTDFALRGQRVSWLQRFIFEKLLRTNISHVSVGYNRMAGERNEQIEAHMWGSPESRFTQGRRTLGNHCFKTFYVAPEHLVSGEDRDKMVELYGEEWRTVLQTKFTEIAQEFYNEDRLRELKNPPLRRALAAIGFRFSLFRKSWQERAQFPSSNEVICSEFALLSTLQCLERLNQQIEREHLQQFGPLETPPQLSPPIRENRRLNRVIPSDLIERTVKLRQATLTPQADCIRAVIQCADRLLY